MADEDQNLEAEAVKEAEVPAWVPEKFRSNPEKFGEAYENLERSFHQTRQELSESQKQWEAYIEQAELAAQQPPANQVDALAERYGFDPDQLAVMKYMAEQVAEEKLRAVTPQIRQATDPLAEQQNYVLAQLTDDLVARQVPDWDEYKSKVGNFIEDNPYLLPPNALTDPQTASKALVSAYKAFRYDELNNQSQSQAEQLAAAQRQAKLQAQTLAGSPGRPEPQDGDKELWERVVNAPRGGL